jgi:hypothetical protein
MDIYYTSIISNDGFGAQFQRIIQTYIYCRIHQLNFVYRPLDFVDHNYNNDNTYIDRLENLMNLKDNIINNINSDMEVQSLEFGSIVMEYVEKNIDNCCESEHMQFIKECFWQNKNKNYFNNNKINIAIHIRRENPHDQGEAGDRVTTPNSYYLNIMNEIREKYNNNDIIFHIYSQGDLDAFQCFALEDVILYLNYDLIESFMGMVSANILVTSPSSLSYVAALISDGEIYYKPFWHNPRKNWLICET